MAKVIPIVTKTPLILCNRCGVKIGEGQTYGYLFYCDTCNAKRLVADQERDKD